MKFSLTEKRIREIIREEILQKESLQSSINLTGGERTGGERLGYSEGDSLEKHSPDSSADPDHLHSDLKTLYNSLRSKLRTAGFPIRVLATYRSIPDQRAAMKSGHSMVDDPYHSYHTSLTRQGVRSSRGLDIALMANQDGASANGPDDPGWDNKMNFYSKLGELINNDTEFTDLRWGGDFSTPFRFTGGDGTYTPAWKGSPMGWDPGHVEMPTDIAQMKADTRAGLEFLSTGEETEDLAPPAGSESSSSTWRCTPRVDTDGDGVLDCVELDGDTDGDGIPNYQDPDSN